MSCRQISTQKNGELMDSEDIIKNFTPKQKQAMDQFIDFMLKRMEEIDEQEAKSAEAKKVEEK